MMIASQKKRHLEHRMIGKSILFTWLALMLASCSLASPQQATQASTNMTKSPGESQDSTQIHLPTVIRSCPANCYFVDSANGSDTNPGNSIDKPWQTLAPVNAKELVPGDIVHFKRGSTWTGGLVIHDSGVNGKPILFTTYGDGPKPVFRNPGDQDHTRAVTINADWVIIEEMMLRDAYEAGAYIFKGADHNVIRDVEVTNVGIGIAINGQYNLVTRNYVHDLHMVVNTPGGHDDYGAIGLGIYNSNNEVSYNRMENCLAPSYDYGTDGGAVEWFGYADNNYVHHNWAKNNNGFFEVGGGSARDTLVAYNVSIDNRDFFFIHLTGTFASIVTNFRLENNTIVETTYPGYAVLQFGGDPTPSTFQMQNNIFYIKDFKVIINKTNFTHNNNLFHLIGGTRLGFDLGAGDKIADPLFINLVGQDFHLQPGSPAIDAGINLGYTLDFENKPVPFGSSPDIGAFEFQGTP